MKKKFPKFKTDKQVEDFVEKADLREYDFSDMKPVKFELRRKDKTVSLRLPEPLLDAVRINAQKMGIPYQRFMRLAIENAITHNNQSS